MSNDDVNIIDTNKEQNLSNILLKFTIISANFLRNL